MRNVNPLHPLLGKIERAENSEVTGKQWESKRAEWVFRKKGLTSKIKPLKSSSDDGLLSLSMLQEFFPEVYLTSGYLKAKIPIHKDTSAVHPAWFKGFLKLPFIESYKDILTSRSDSVEIVGMVFPRKGFQNGLILHNGHWLNYVPQGSGFHLYRGKNDRVLTVQSFSDFVTCLGN